MAEQDLDPMSGTRNAPRHEVREMTRELSTSIRILRM